MSTSDSPIISKDSNDDNQISVPFQLLPDGVDFDQSAPTVQKKKRVSAAWRASQLPRLAQLGDIDLTTLREYFHIPITEAAQMLRVSTTYLKKICRQNGISRWPQRKLKSIAKTIDSLEKQSSKDPTVRHNIKQQLETAKLFKDQLFIDPNLCDPSKPVRPRRRRRVFPGHNVSLDEEYKECVSDSDNNDVVETLQSTTLHTVCRRRSFRRASQKALEHVESLMVLDDEPAPVLRSTGAVSNRTKSVRVPSIAHTTTTQSSSMSLLPFSGQTTFSSLPSKLPRVSNLHSLQHVDQQYNGTTQNDMYHSYTTTTSNGQYGYSTDRSNTNVSMHGGNVNQYSPFGYQYPWPQYVPPTSDVVYNYNQLSMPIQPVGNYYPPHQYGFTSDQIPTTNTTISTQHYQNGNFQ